MSFSNYKLFIVVFIFYSILNINLVLAGKKSSDIHESDSTIRPLTELLSVSTEELEKGSMCTDDARPNQTIGNVIAFPLSYFINGSNTVFGHCDKNGDSACEVNITHIHDEDVWTRHIVFNSIAGKPDIKSVRCLDTF